MRAYRLILLIPVLIYACKTSQPTSSDTASAYSEDLSYLRPDLSTPDTTVMEDTIMEQRLPVTQVIGQVSIKSELDSINKLIAERNRQVKYVDGYAIQIYTGNDRTAANNARELAMEVDSSLNPVISYYQPTYKVKVGEYTNRLEAHKAYESIKTIFPRALLIPERIKINYD